jgi:hypothetical protein
MRHRRFFGIGLALTLLILVVLPLLASWAWWLPAPSPAVRSTGTNALWLRHSWVGDEHSGAEYSGLADTLRQNQISDAYFHVGPIDGDGSIPLERYAHAPELLAALHSRAPTTHIQAYMGQLLVAVGGPVGSTSPSGASQAPGNR